VATVEERLKASNMKGQTKKKLSARSHVFYVKIYSKQAEEQFTAIGDSPSDIIGDSS
jgi:hypothetical protein